MRTGKLTRAVAIRPWAFAPLPAAEFPAGTAVHSVSDTVPSIMWAVTSTEVVARATGDAKRAEGYNVYVPADAVEEDQ
jgi:hypothetical protein